MLQRALAFAVTLFAVSSCGGPIPCELTTDACACQRNSACRVVTDGCFCPNFCGEKILCACGGNFVRCEAAPAR